MRAQKPVSPPVKAVLYAIATDVTIYTEETSCRQRCSLTGLVLHFNTQ